MLKKREKSVLIELIKNGRMPDRRISKKIGISQPTATRIRQRLEKKEYISRYAAVPNLETFGLSIIVMTFFQWNDYSKKEEIKKAAKEVRNLPQTIFSNEGEGLHGKTGVIISAHKTFKDYECFIKQLRETWGSYVNDIESFITPIDKQYIHFNTGDVTINAISEQDI